MIILALIAFWCIRTVNDFKKKEIRVQEGISGIEVALTKRYDMLTKMLDTAKGYMAHESELFTKVIELRRGGCKTATSPPTIRRSPWSRQKFWQARTSRRNSSPQTQANAKM